MDPSVAEAPVVTTQAQSTETAAPPTARGGLNLIRRVADSLGGGRSAESAAAKPFKGDSIDGDGSPDDDALQIPAFLRRQAN